MTKAQKLKSFPARSVEWEPADAWDGTAPEAPEDSKAGCCFHMHPDGTQTEFTPEEYAREPIGRIFIGIGGFKPPKGKTYKPQSNE